MIDTKKIRENTDLREVVQRMGIRIVKNEILCPFHDERTPSCHIYRDHFYCFGCGEKGDAITLVMKCLGMGFQEACNYLNDGEITAGCTPACGPLRKEKTYPLDTIHLQHLMGGNRLTDAVWDFLRSRNIKFDIIGLEDIALLPSDAPFFAGGHPFFHGDSLLFALRDATGRLVNVQARWCGADVPKSQRYKVVPNQPLGLLGLFTLRGYDGHSPIVACEGPTDWMALRMCGFRHVVAFIGSGTAKLQYIREIRAAVGSHVPLWLHVFPDRDSAGQNFVTGLRLHGEPLGIHVVPHEDFASTEEYGYCKDVGDMWAAAGRMGKEEAVRREMQRLVG